MDKKLYQEVLKEAINIGDGILKKAIEKDGTVYWETLTMTNDRILKLTSQSSLYSGVSGVCLYLIELFNVTGDKKYLDTATKGCLWLILHSQNKMNFSFLTGNTGIAYLLLKIFELTGLSIFKENALSIIDDSDDQNQQPLNEYLSGIAGNILGLLHVHQISKNESILEKIDHSIKKILENIKLDSSGIYFDRMYSNIKPLCGASHGASGIGFVFLELGNYFQNPSFYIIAQQLFLYESKFYDKNFKNWIDLRLYDETEENFQIYSEYVKKQDFAKFHKLSQMNVWCHGAPGISLIRTRAYELLNNDKYLREIKIGIKNVKKSLEFAFKGFENSPILCHGIAGNADLFIEYYNVTKNEKYLNLAWEAAKIILSLKEKNGHYVHGYFSNNGPKEDISLFMGSTGVGYFFIRLLNNAPSILLPKIENQFEGSIKDYKYLNLSKIEVKDLILSSLFNRTIMELKEVLKLEYNLFLENTIDCDKNLIKTFFKFIKLIIKNDITQRYKKLNTLFIYEFSKLSVDKKNTNDVLCYFLEKNNQLSVEKNNHDIKVNLNPQVKIIQGEIDKDLIQKITNSRNYNSLKENYLVLIPSWQGTTTFSLTELTFLIVTNLRKHKDEAIFIEDLVKEIKTKIVSDNNFTGIEEIIYRQVMELIKINLVQVSNEN